MIRNKRMLAISAVASVALLSGCSLFKSQEASKPIDPPQVHTDGTSEETSAQVRANYKPTLYFADADGYVAPLSLGFSYDGVDYAKTALEYMVKGGPAEGMLPEGFTALLPEGTKVLSIDVNKTDRTATVDFSKEFTQYPAQQERKILEAVTYALTDFPTVDYVELWVEGKRLTEMPVAGTPLDEPLSRKFGINVEMPEGVHFTHATPVTLYFLNQTADSYTYYVPVTRMIGLTDDLAGATVAELAKGPLDPNKLDAVLIGGTASKVTAEGKVVKVDFDSSFVTEDQKIPAEALQAVVLSLTDTVAAEGVQITVGGKAQAVGTDNKDYGAKPVTRPNRVNLYEM
ncbi:GerMN domain-containing protein [Paenibacillus thermotolerans]|uniref:GerMN domain-containing protein n=1 Tax=Paenibacillus thermotolerans TaxID=3027807 RepID=UPI002368127B|nr:MULTISPECIES: GerMN domain-containing protein [unclassified Paenibacillus]